MKMFLATFLAKQEAKRLVCETKTKRGDKLSKTYCLLLFALCNKTVNNSELQSLKSAS
jgi:hypothetical protein